MTFHYPLVLNELLESEPLVPTIPCRPYEDNKTYRDKVDKTYRLLLRATSLRQRQRTLLYAFYLGELMGSSEISKQQKLEAKRWISSYYFLTSVRVFHIFEANMTQIYRTKHITLTNITRLSKDEYASLCTEEVLPGGSNLSEGFCNP